MKRPLAGLVIAAMVCGFCSAQPKPERTAEQRAFGLGMDGPVVQHPVALSNEELSALASDELMKRELDRDPPIPKLTREGLEAGVIHLGLPGERDLVVVGSGALFAGANIGPFWIIRDLPSGPVIVLHVTTLSLSVLNSRTKGLRDIELFAATAIEGTTTALQFDGTRYALFKQRSGPLGK
jgi:hypothetical protein